MLKNITFVVCLLATVVCKKVHVSSLSLFYQYDSHPSLARLAKAQKDTELHIRLDVGEEKQSHLFLDRFHLQLLEEKAAKKRPTLPGIDGANPHLSSGARRVEVLECPSFIDMFGTQKVKFENGCWEMVWRDEAFAGTLVCGFDVPKEATRNGAKLPSGRVYVSFIVWTKDGLLEQQARKFKIQKECKEYMQEKEDALHRYQTEENILMKALHYRNAAAAYEKYSMSGIYDIRKVPDNDDVIAIQDNVLLATKGTVWTVGQTLFSKKKKLLGNAVIRPIPKTNDENISQLRP